MLDALKDRARKVPLLVRLNRALRAPRPQPPDGPGKIARYRRALPSGDELRVVFGGHWSDNPGWLPLNEEDQDVTQPLAFEDGALDVVFSEHVIEHVPLTAGVQFPREAYRILKPAACAGLSVRCWIV